MAESDVLAETGDRVSAAGPALSDVEFVCRRRVDTNRMALHHGERGAQRLSSGRVPSGGFRLAKTDRRAGFAAILACQTAWQRILAMGVWAACKLYEQES